MQKVTIIGNLGNDAKIVNKNGGTPFVSFSVGCNESYTNQNGEKVENSTWYNCIYKHTGVTEFMKKGTKVYIEGFPTFKTYIGQDNKTYIDVTVSVRVLELLSPKKEAV